MISDVTPKITYDVSGVVTNGQQFDFSFPYFATSDVFVILTSSLGVETVLTPGTQYTVSAPGVANPKVTITTGWAAGTYAYLTVYRVVPYVQDANYVNGDKLDLEVVEDSLDKIVAQVQQVRETGARTVVTPLSDPAGSLVLPGNTARAGKYLAFDSNGDAVATSSGHVDWPDQDILDAVKRVDGEGSGLDADTLDGSHLEALTDRLDVLEATSDVLADFRSWDSTRTYALNDPASHNGIPYRSLVAGNINYSPATNPDKWEVTGGGSTGAVQNFLKKSLNDAGSIVAANSIVATGTTYAAWDATATDLLNAGAFKVIADGAGDTLDLFLSTLNPNDVGQPFMVKFTYKASADAACVVSLYDGATDVQTAIGALPLAGGTAQTIAGAVFPTNVIGANTQRLRFTFASAVTLYLADVSVAPYVATSGSAISEWQSYVPTFGAGFGTVTAINMQYRRVGSNLELQGVFTLGTVSASAATVSLPSGLSVDTDFTQLFVGLVQRDYATSAYKYTSVLALSGASTLSFGEQTDSSSGWVIRNGSSFNASTLWSIQATVPIAQWTSNVNLAGDFAQYRSHNGTLEEAGIGGSAILTTTPAGTSDVYTISFPAVQAGDLFVTELQRGGSGPWTHTTDTIDALRFDGTNFIGAGCYYDGTNVKLVRGKYRSGTSATWAGITAGTRWRVRKVSNGNMAEVPPTVSCITNDTATAASAGPLIWTAVSEDTHGGMNIATGIYTVKVPGLYSVGGPVYLDGTSEQDYIQLWKNGTLVGTIAFAQATSGSTGKGGSPIPVRCSIGDTLELRHTVTASRSWTICRTQFTRIGA
jgi:hypothetical protein